MGLLKIFHGFAHKNSYDKKSTYIFYKIVDSNSASEEFILQCINTKAIFHLKITEIVFDVDILYSLHPIQACYIGIEYSKYLKKTEASTTPNKNYKLEKYVISRYGKYHLYYQSRDGSLGFICERTNQEFIMDPRDIALSEELISEFDAVQSFYIGLLAGLKLNNLIYKTKTAQEPKQPYLYIVK